MTEAYYIIPMVAGPYSRNNTQRPEYVDEIRCNWTGHNVDELGVYVCKVNTTAAKHADLNSRALVFQLRWDLDLSIGSLTTLQHNALNNWLTGKGLVAASDSETVGEVLGMRPRGMQTRRPDAPRSRIDGARRMPENHPVEDATHVAAPRLGNRSVEEDAESNIRNRTIGVEYPESNIRRRTSGVAERRHVLAWGANPRTGSHRVHGSRGATACVSVEWKAPDSARPDREWGGKVEYPKTNRWRTRHMPPLRGWEMV